MGLMVFNLINYLKHYSMKNLGFNHFGLKDLIAWYNPQVLIEVRYFASNQIVVVISNY